MTIHRRDAMIRLGTLGAGALGLPQLLGAGSAAASSAATVAGSRTGKAKSCILVYLWGGPPQQDMFDMKPDAPDGVRSQFSPIRTNVPGITLCDQMPLLARQADKLCLVRSVSHGSDIHEESVYHTLTGQVKKGLVVPRNARRRTDFPGVGSIVSYFSRPGILPSSVTLPRPIGHDGVTYAGTYSGFLGPRHDPFELREAPNSNDRPAHEIGLPAGVAESRLIARRGLLSLLEDHQRAVETGRAGAEMTGFRDQAWRMVTSPVAKRAFDLNREPAGVRDRYGRNEYGESFLLARRLVEAGVRLVSMCWMYFMPNGKIANVWDNHGGTAGLGGVTGYAMLKEKYCIPPLDLGLSALLEDLAARGLLDETLVLVTGEFGRTPKINNTAGRDHWGKCYSVALAGGGVRGGQVYGSSDAQAAYPKDNPVGPEDVLATAYAAMGISPEAEVPDQFGRPHRITDGKAIGKVFV